MAGFRSERFVGYQRLHDALNFNDPGLFLGERDHDAVRAVQMAFLDLRANRQQSSHWPRAGIPNGVYDTFMMQQVAEFQRTQRQTPTGILDGTALGLLDKSFPRFSAAFLVFDASGNQIGNPATLNIFSPQPPGRIGTWNWPTAPLAQGMPITVGDWGWVTSTSQPTQDSLFEVVCDTSIFPGSPILRLLAPAALWKGKTGQPVPWNNWFPTGARGTGFDFGGNPVTWRVT
jgi:hypothetical protein